MAKVKFFKTVEYSTKRDLGTYGWIYCLGCKGYHRLRIRMPKYPTQQEINDQKNNVHGLWTYSGTARKPTFRASLLVNGKGEGIRCHSFITDGMIQYLDDCQHELAGQTIELPEIKI